MQNWDLATARKTLRVSAAAILIVLFLASCGSTDEEPPEGSSPPATEQEQGRGEDRDTGSYDKYGTFDPVSESDDGDSTIALPEGVTAGIVTAEHEGSSNFVIEALDANNQSTGDLLVNEIGAYSGTTAFGLQSLGEAAKIRVKADGDWSIEIAPISSAPELALPASGTGDSVHLYNGDSADWAITHSGESNFVVAQYGESFPNLAVNEIGNYEGTVPMQEGPTVVVIQADGKWTISVG